MKDEYYYWKSFGKKEISPWLSRLGSLCAPSLAYPDVFACYNVLYQIQMAALVSDDDGPIDPFQIAIENGAELSKPERASISKDCKIVKTSWQIQGQ